LEGYRCAVVFHHGARGEELLARVSCSYVEFFLYRALPGSRDSAAKILSSDAAVFTSALAVRRFAEVGGPQALKELAKKEKEHVTSPKRSLFPPLLQRIYCRQVFTVDDLSSVFHEVLKQVATR
jgi:hypothetical protein